MGRVLEIAQIGEQPFEGVRLWLKFSVRDADRSAVTLLRERAGERSHITSAAEGQGRGFGNADGRRRSETC